GAIDQRAVIDVAFGKIEFAANHIVAGAGVAADIDALNIGSRTFIHGEGDRNGVLLEIAVTTRADHREGITAPRGLDLHFFDGFFQRFGVVEPTDADAREKSVRSEEHTSELQSHLNLVCRLLLEKKKKNE